jgi:hypothetical protein
MRGDGSGGLSAITIQRNWKLVVWVPGVLRRID